SGDHRHLPSFPTRRSSDLRCKAEGGGKRLAADVAGRRARRSRSSVRPCQSRTRMERPFQEIGWNTAMATVERLAAIGDSTAWVRSEEHTSELQSRENLVCR